MALNEHNIKRQYTKYKRHVNESKERIDANTINKIQEDINIQQEESNTIKDTAFEERIYTIFNSNLYVNSMFVDYFRTGEYVNLSQSTNINLNNQKAQLTIGNKSNNGIAISTPIYSVHGEEVELNDFFLITNEYVPVGAEIKYYLETSTGKRCPITPNALKLPLHLHENLTLGFKVVADMKANALNESPTINGYAVFYWDADVEKRYGLINPDLSRFPTIELGSDDGKTIIIRDRAQEDKVVRIIEPTDTVKLTYDFDNNDGRLSVVETNWPNYDGYEVIQTHELQYGDYTNSNDEIENVLQSVNQKTTIKDNLLINGGNQ